jgi:hypothetical protein
MWTVDVILTLAKGATGSGDQEEIFRFRLISGETEVAGSAVMLHNSETQRILHSPIVYVPTL